MRVTFMRERIIACYTCSRGLEPVTGRMPCEELAGWLTISYWKGKEAVEHYNFCSPQCLRQWMDEMFPGIPEVYLKSFDEQDN